MIRVMSYNICNAHGITAAGEDKTQQDIAATAEVIAAAGVDLVSLNEVDRHTERFGADRDLAAELGAAAGLPHVAFGRAIAMSGGDYGNALLSRWPLERVTVTQVSPGTADGEEDRCVLSAEVVTPEGRLRVMSTHLSWLHESLRMRGAQTLVGLLDGALPTVLMGDLNAEPGSAPLAVLATALRDTAAGHPEIRTFPAHAPRVKIDHIFVSPDVRVREIAVRPSLASDHLPLIATLALSSLQTSNIQH